MNRFSRCGLIFPLFCLLSPPSFAQLPYQNPDLPPGERARDLISRMTLDEKIYQMQNSAAAVPRLGVPAYDWWNEALHGVARAGTATVFPQAIGLAATWDTDLLCAEATVISTEARAKFRASIKKGSTNIYEGLTFWSPNINIFRDPRWGRGQETYGEDPFLTARMGVAFVKGIQGNDSRYFRAIATPKHFAVHSGPEPLRHQFDARPPLRDLYETYLPAFEATITEAGAWSVMGAYNRVYGEAACGSRLLLEENLRGRWKFKGYVVSDCGAIDDIFSRHKLVSGAAEASALAVKRGCDLTCGNEYRALARAVEAGLITEQEIAVSAARLMEARFRLGLFDPPERVPYASIPETENDTPAHDSLARVAARESIVLLKNKEGALPLSPSVRSIAVVGPLANRIEVLLGNYNGTPSHPVTFFEGIRDRAGKDCRVDLASGCEVADGLYQLVPVAGKYLSSLGAALPTPGLHADFFPNRNLSGSPCAARTDSIVAFEWGGGSPGPGIPENQFSARWTGLLTPDFTGQRVFGAIVDDGFRLYINDSLFIDEWSYGAPRPVAKPYFFEAGKSYRIRLEYFEIDGGASLTLGWVPEGADPEAEALALARRSDVVVAVMGISPDLEGEEMNVKVEGFSGGDRTTLGIPDSQVRLLKKLVELGKPVVLVLTNGSALSIPWEAGHVSAIVDAWYPGQRGGSALADVLFGDYNPAGRLPVTFYASVNDLPAFDDYRMEGKTYRYFRGKALYPFGFGLSYSTFSYETAVLSKKAYRQRDTIAVNVTVKNTGTRDGDEVVQVYARHMRSISGDPITSLKGFTRVRIGAGESRRVVVRIPVRELRTFDELQSDYVVRPGTYELQVGSSSSDIRATSTISIGK
jgi:beta-glucosidase